MVATVVARAAHLPVETIGSHFGPIDPSIPHPQLPHVTVSEVTGLVAPAFTIAMLAAIESLLSAVVADGMIGGRHRSNMELVAQGVANIASPMFGGIPATGAIARTATNVKNGGRTPIAGMTHALTLLLVTLFFGQYAAQIPLAVLAAILVVVAYHMSEWRTFRAELRMPKSDVAVLLTTFGLTVLVDLTVAIAVGMVLAAFLFIRRMASVTNVSIVSGGVDDDLSLEPAEAWRRAIPPGCERLRDHGAIFLRGRRDLSPDARRPRRASAGAHHSHARRACARLDGHARAARRGETEPARGRRGHPRGRAGATARGARKRRASSTTIGAANVTVDIDDALARVYELDVRPTPIVRVR